MNTRMQGLVLWTSEKQLRDERHIHTHTHAYTLAPKTAGQIVDRVNGYTYKNVFHTFFFQSIYFIPFGQLNVTNWLYTCRWVWRHLSSSSVQKMSVYRWRSHMLHKRWLQGVPMRNIFPVCLRGTIPLPALPTFANMDGDSFLGYSVAPEKWGQESVFPLRVWQVHGVGLGDNTLVVATALLRQHCPWH